MTASECLAEFRTVYAPDLVNMGESARVAGLDPGLVAQVERLNRWMDAARDLARRMWWVTRTAGQSQCCWPLAIPSECGSWCCLPRPTRIASWAGRRSRFYGTLLADCLPAALFLCCPGVLYRRSLERTWGDPTRRGTWRAGGVHGLPGSAGDYTHRRYHAWLGRGHGADRSGLPKLAERPMSVDLGGSRPGGRAGLRA